MTTGILHPENEEQPPASGQPSSPRRSTSRRGLIALSVVVAILAAYSLWGIQRGRSTLRAQRNTISELSGKLAALTSDTATLQSKLTDTRKQLDAAQEHLAAADQTADRARALALRNRSETRRSAQQLEGAIDSQQKQVGVLKGAVDGVQTNVIGNRKDIDRAFGDLTQQSGLIARNRDELTTLKHRTDRSYFEFDLHKSRQFTRVGPLSVRLNKTDEKHQRYTVTVVVNDKRVEKKDNALLEPVQFYIAGTHKLLELVAQQIGHGRIAGYVSTPKEVSAQSEGPTA
jgi:outer membrane murein-binding lipoprotein Lpp